MQCLVDIPGKPPPQVDLEDREVEEAGWREWKLQLGYNVWENNNINNNLLKNYSML